MQCYENGLAPVYDPAPEPSREAPAEIAPERVTTVVDK